MSVKISSQKSFIFFLLLVFIILAAFSWKPKICFTPDEVFYYKSSQTLNQAQHIFGPKYFEENRFQKPPLFYIAVFCSYAIFGVNWFAARFVSILAALFLLVITYQLAFLMYGQRRAFSAAAMLATSILYFRCARIALPEMAFVCMMAMSILLIYKAIVGNDRRQFIHAFIFMGIAGLIKGPIGFILPISMLLFMQISLRAAEPVSVPWARGIFMIVVLSLLWIVPGLLYYGENFKEHLIGVEVVDRLTEKNPIYSEGVVLYYFKKLFFYIPAVITRFMPWSILGPLFLLFGCRSPKTTLNEKAKLFLKSWIVSWIILFTLIPEKREHYLLSLLPALALLLGALIDFDRDRVGKIFNNLLAVMLGIFLTASAIILPLYSIDGVDRLSEKLAVMLENEQTPVAVSWRLDPQEAELYLDRKVFKIEERYFEEFDRALGQLQKMIARAGDRGTVFYCLIADYEYQKYFEQFIENIAANIVPVKEMVIAEDRWFRKKIHTSALKSKNFKEAFTEKVYLIRVARASGN